MNKKQPPLQQDKHAELPTSNGVIIKVYEEPLLRPEARRPIERSRPRSAPSLGYDRKQLLLAYSQHLRQFHAQQNQINASRLSWSKWKAASVCSDCGMKKNSLRWRTQLWIHRILRRIRRRRAEYNHITTAAEDSHSCSCHRQWRRLLRGISWVWSCGGCCHELSS